MESLITKLKLVKLQNEYSEITKFIFNLQSHIELLNNKLVINNINKNMIMHDLYNILAKKDESINSLYNSYIIKNQNTKYNNDSLVFLNKYENNINIESIYKHLTVLNNITDIETSEKLIFNNNPFNEIKSKLLNICKSVGFHSITNCLKFLLGDKYTLYYKKSVTNKLKFFDKFFIPIRFKLEKYESINEVVFFNNKDQKQTELLNMIVDLNISFPLVENTYIVLSGFFKNDTLNVILKTCQICYPELYEKKKNIEKKLEKKIINNKFKKFFLKYLSIYEFLIFDEIEIVHIIQTNYKLFLDLANKTFMTVMRDFIRNDNTIKYMYDSIRVLLLGDEENINVAGILFGLTKDKKLGSNNVANVIYNNLNFIYQIKLKKTVPNLKNEIDKLKSINIDELDFKKVLLSMNNVPDNIKSMTLEKIEEMKNSGNDYFKQLTFVKTIIKFPWPSIADNQMFYDLQEGNKSKLFLDNLQKKLDSKTYGHKESKSLIKEIVAKWISNPDSSGNSIGFVGPPGVGKTLLVKSIGEALNIPFAQITLGGQNDGELLHGHGYTYSGSQPGLIIKKMVEAGQSRVILYFDELDKACSKTSGVNEIMSILIHLTDPNMNKSFQDRFFQGIDFPLNKVILMFSYNNSELIDPILLDRLTEINVKPYSSSEKLIICKNFIIPEMASTVNMNITDINFPDVLINYLIDNYTLEAGVRDLKRKIEKIFMNYNLKKLYDGIKLPIKIEKSSLIEIFKDPKIDVEKIHTYNEVGVINGLYATKIGTGGIVPIQIFKNYGVGDGNFIFKLTGSQGKVMKESVQCAFTAALDYIEKNKEEYGIENITDHLKTNFPFGFHIHAPSGATPKDGPSAGCAFTTAFISRILNKKIKRDIAMTGEIDLCGNISKIGGLLYKLLGAKQAGVKQVFICHENKKDFEKIKKENSILKNFKVKIVKKIDDLVNDVLVN
jgi:endopeptidase La